MAEIIKYENGQFKQYRVMRTSISQCEWLGIKNTEAEVRSRLAKANMAYQEERQRIIEESLTNQIYNWVSKKRGRQWEPKSSKLENHLGNPKNAEGAREHFEEDIYRSFTVYFLEPSDKQIPSLQCRTMGDVEAQEVEIKETQWGVMGNDGYRDLIEEARLAADKKGMPYVMMHLNSSGTYTKRENLVSREIPYTVCTVSFFSEKNKNE